MIIKQINTIIEEVSPMGGELNENNNLKDDLGIDSFTLVELLVALEEEFSN